MAALAALDTSSVPTKLISITLRKKSPGIGPSLLTMRRGHATPAQFTTRLRPPISRCARSMAASTASSLVTSAVWNIAFGPSASTAWVPASRLTSNNVTRAPLATKRCAVAYPRPDAPPVMTARTSPICMLAPPPQKNPIDALAARHVHSVQRGEATLLHLVVDEGHFAVQRAFLFSRNADSPSFA